MFYVSVCLPMFVWLIGLIVAITRWKRSPKKSMLVVIGLVIMTLGGISELARYAVSMNVSPREFGMMFPVFLRVLNYVEIFFQTTGWILCIFAIFSPDKKAAQSES